MYLLIEAQWQGHEPGTKNKTKHVLIYYDRKCSVTVGVPPIPIVLPVCQLYHYGCLVFPSAGRPVLPLSWHLLHEYYRTVVLQIYHCLPYPPIKLSFNQFLTREIGCGAKRVELYANSTDK